MLRNALTTPDAAFDTIDHRIERFLQKFELASQEIELRGFEPLTAENRLR